MNKITIGGVTITLPGLAALANQPAWLVLALAVFAGVTVLGIIAIQTGLAETALLLRHGASAERIAELRHNDGDAQIELPKRADEDA